MLSNSFCLSPSGGGAHTLSFAVELTDASSPALALLMHRAVTYVGTAIDLGLTTTLAASVCLLWGFIGLSLSLWWGSLAAWRLWAPVPLYRVEGPASTLRVNFREPTL